MSIAIDFDGVLSNTIKKWISIFNVHYSAKYDNLQLSYNKIREFDFYKSYNISHDDSREIFAQCWAEWDMLESTEFMLDQKTKRLSDMCGGLDIVTANNPIYRQFIEKFLDKYKIQYDNMIFEENKEKLNHDTFIDDSPINAQKIFDAGKSILLYNQPWNRDISSKKTDTVHLSRVYSLDHAIHLLEN